MQACYMFPGQGTQKNGMILSMGEKEKFVQNVFECASDIFGFDVFRLCQNCTEEELADATKAQAIITAMNMAYYELLIREGIYPTAVLGHSLGELSAAACAGAFSMEMLFKIVKYRAELMDSIKGNGALCTTVGLGLSDVNVICDRLEKSGGNISIALHNSDKQIVVGGDVSTIDTYMDMAKEYGCRITKKLNVAHPFHTKMMKYMEKDFANYLRNIPFGNLKCKFIANCKGDYVRDSNEIREDLIMQICHMVRWRDSLIKISEGIDVVAETGYGRALTKMYMEVNGGRRCYSLYEQIQYEQFCSLVKAQ